MTYFLTTTLQANVSQTPSSQDLCIFCASRLNFPPPLPLVPRTRPLYTQRRALQSSARTKKPMAAAAALQDEDQQEADISRPPSAPVNSRLRPSSLGRTGQAASSKIPAFPALAPVKLSWDGWSAALGAASDAQVRSGAPPEQKGYPNDSETESRHSDGTAAKVGGRSGSLGKKSTV